MDKKNTMLLTVIAVATLLVAVVGATFAYFTAVNEATSATNVGVNATTTAAPGTVALDGETKNLSLNMLATQMTSAVKGKYYAVTTGNPVKDTAQEHQIATLATTGNTGKYVCTYVLTVTATGLTEEKIVAEDGAVVFSTKASATPVNDAVVTFDKSTVTFADLKDGSETVTATIKIDGNQNATFVADAYIENRDADQNYLGNLTANITISSAEGTTAFGCQVVDSFE